MCNAALEYQNKPLRGKTVRPRAPEVRGGTRPAADGGQRAGAWRRVVPLVGGGGGGGPLRQNEWERRRRARARRERSLGRGKTPAAV